MLLSIAVAGTVIPVHGASTWYVDGALGTDDSSHGTGPGNSAFKTIQYAINDARVVSGDTISVAAGTYDEQVVTTKSLTLQGAGDTTIVKPSSAAKLTTVLDGNHYGGIVKIAGIIVANVASGADVTVKNLKVDGSSVTTKPTGAEYFAGIFYGETGGIVDTVSVVGGGAWSPGRGFGAYLSAVTNTVSVEVKGSTITNYDKSGIDAYGNKLTVDMHHNTVTGRGPISDECQNGIILDTTTGTVNSNTVSNNVYQDSTWTATGIAFVDADGSATGNTLTDNQLGAGAQGLDPGSWTVSFINNRVNAAGLATAVAGLNAATYYTAEAFVTVTMDGNQLTGGPGNGIYIGDILPEVAGSVMATISNNLISGWQHGINLASSVVSGSTMTGNTIQNNVGTGSGVHVGAAVNAANVHVNFNSIVGNSGTGVYGVSNGGAGTLDAENNWWGCSAGPGNPGCDTVLGAVDFTPWLTSPMIPGPPSSGTSVGTSPGTVQTFGSIPSGSMPLSSAPPQAQALSYPDGFFVIIITGITSGSTVTITLTLSHPAAGVQLWKYNTRLAAWQQVPILSASGNTVQFQLTDGGTFDLDNIAGQITDPVGAGFTPVPVGPVGGYVSSVDRVAVLTPYLALFGLVGAVVAVFAIRRKRQA
jgi:hypothetical protein